MRTEKILKDHKQVTAKVTANDQGEFTSYAIWT